MKIITTLMVLFLLVGCSVKKEIVVEKQETQKIEKGYTIDVGSERINGVRLNYNQKTYPSGKWIRYYSNGDRCIFYPTGKIYKTYISANGLATETKRSK